MNNFKCDKCETESIIAKFTIAVRGEELVYFTNKNMNVRITCSNKQCKKHPLTAIDANVEGEDYKPLYIMKIAGMDANQRTEYFNKRARDNFKKHGRDEKMDKLKKYGAR